jgi:predicted  nucleic acid-binding Zn-ribbon protein
MLKDNLVRNGVDLVLDGNLMYYDVNNRRIGINTNFPSNSLTVNGNTLTNTIYANNFFFGNGSPLFSYSNSNVAAYLAAGIDTTILAINANMTSANSAISTINANVAAANLVISYHTTNINTINSNILAANSVISTINANVAAANLNISSNTSRIGNTEANVIAANSAISTINSNILAANSAISTVNANVAAANVVISYHTTNINTINSNVSAANLAISTINSNILAANSAISTVNANVAAANLNIANNTTSINTINSNVVAANSAISTINSNVAAANSAIATLQTQVYSNANIAAYLPIYSGNIKANVITAATIGNTGTNLTGLINTNAQPYITSLGTLSSLAITNGVTANAFTTLYGGQITGYMNGPIGANTANTGAFTTVSATGNISGAYITASNGINGVIGNITPNIGTFTNLTVTGSLVLNSFSVPAGNLGNFYLSNNTMTVTNTDGNINIAPLGNGIVNLNTVTAVQLPSGNNITRPLVPTPGMFRYNITATVLEYYNGFTWSQVGGAATTTIISDQFTGDGSNVTFSLSQNSTTSGTLVSVNGVTQTPYVGYTIYGNVLTFNEAPISTDVIDARSLVTTGATTSLYYGNSIVYFDTPGNGYSVLTSIDGNIKTSIGIANTNIRNTLVVDNNILWANGNAFTSPPGGFTSSLQFNDSRAFNGSTYLQYNKVTGNLVSNSTTKSTSLTTGAVVIGNGLAVGGNLFTNAIYSDNHYFANGTTITTPAGGTNTMMQFNDSTNFSGATYLQYIKASGNLVSNSTTTSTSATTGAIVVGGGIGIGGNLNVSGTINGAHNGTVGATTASTGVFTTLTATSGYQGAASGPFNGTVGASTANTGAFTTVTASSTLGVSGTANFAGTVTAATINATSMGNAATSLTGTIQTASQTNVTAVGTLTSLAVSGLVTLTGGAGSDQIRMQNGGDLVIYNGDNSGTTRLYCDVNGVLNVSGEIRASNNITAYYSSDRRLKENIIPIANPLVKLNKINGVNFNWNESEIAKRGGEDGYYVRKADVGVIAQEIQEVIPEAVATREDGTLAVNYEKIIPLLIEAIKELNAKVEKLEKGK